MSETERLQEVILVGVDDSEQSRYALEWTLDHLLSSLPLEERRRPFVIILVHARPTAASVPEGHMAAPVETDPGEIEAIENAKRICKERDLKHVHSYVWDGDARNVLCEAVKRYKAAILVVGSAMDRADLGSVSDYCARHAKCSVMIVKKPNI